MIDVARLAGVSPMTVSRVLNGRARVHQSRRDRVLAAAATLNYAAHCEASSLAGTRRLRLGFLYRTPDMRSGSYMSEVLIGLVGQASLSNMQLIVERCDEDEPIGERAEALIDKGVDGVVLPPSLSDDASIIERMIGAGKPVALIACGRPDPRASAVRIDDRAAAYAMTRHLVGLGHRRIGFITGRPNQSATSQRLAGYHAAVKEFGADPAPELVAQGQFTYQSGLDAAELLMALPVRPTAIFACNDDMAAATVAVVHRMGLDVPGDMTVTGFDDTALAEIIWPALTTVHQPTVRMAQAAVQSLVRRINAQYGSIPGPPEHIVVDYQLVRRQSDAAPRLRPPLAPVTEGSFAVLGRPVHGPDF
jgi:LacI family transcriptional regulator